MDSNEDKRLPAGLSRSIWVLIGFLAISGYFLVSEHRAHFITYLPFVLLAACPLLHLFHGHGGHGGHGRQRDDATGANRPDQPPAKPHEHH